MSKPKIPISSGLLSTYMIKKKVSFRVKRLRENYYFCCVLSLSEQQQNKLLKAPKAINYL